MKHMKSLSKETLPAKAEESEIVCGYLFTPSFTKCADAGTPLAAILKRVPVG